MKLEIDYSNCLDFITEKEITEETIRSISQLDKLVNRTGEGNEFTGWLDLPEKASGDIEKIEKTAQRLRKQSDITVVIGIGGSYLGAKAVIEALKPPVNIPGKESEHEVLFAGQNISEEYLSAIKDYLSDRTFNIIVISKSGTTTEPAIAFRILRKLLESKVSNEAARNHIVAVTDKEKGALRKLSEIEGYDTFIIPNNVGGRYSVLTPVGLLPIAVAGLDIRELTRGAVSMVKNTRDNRSATNPALTYAAIRTILYKKGKYIEMLVNYEPSLQYILEWWKQLVGESEGKSGRGIFPASANFTTDLHSMGQYMQDGERFIMETVLSVKEHSSELTIPHDKDNLDNLNYLAGKRLSEVNARAEEGTVMAHREGGVPVTRILLPAITEKWLGSLLYFFEISCAISGYILGVNPFNQPGVEAYKKNMFRLLGKPE